MGLCRSAAVVGPPFQGVAPLLHVPHPEDRVFEKVFHEKVHGCKDISDEILELCVERRDVKGHRGARTATTSQYSPKSPSLASPKL